MHRLNLIFTRLFHLASVPFLLANRATLPQPMTPHHRFYELHSMSTMCHSYRRQRRCECGFVTHSWNAQRACLRMRAETVFCGHPEEDLFGMCGTIRYRLEKVDIETSISTCGSCARRHTRRQLLGGSRTRTHEHLDFVKVRRVPTREYEGKAR